MDGHHLKKKFSEEKLNGFKYDQLNHLCTRQKFAKKFYTMYEVAYSLCNCCMLFMQGYTRGENEERVQRIH